MSNSFFVRDRQVVHSKKGIGKRLIWGLLACTTLFLVTCSFIGAQSATEMPKASEKSQDKMYIHAFRVQQQMERVSSQLDERGKPNSQPLLYMTKKLALSPEESKAFIDAASKFNQAEANLKSQALQIRKSQNNNNGVSTHRLSDAARSTITDSYFNLKKLASDQITGIRLRIGSEAAERLDYKIASFYKSEVRVRGSASSSLFLGSNSIQLQSDSFASPELLEGPDPCDQGGQCSVPTVTLEERDFTADGTLYIASVSYDIEDGDELDDLLNGCEMIGSLIIFDNGNPVDEDDSDEFSDESSDSGQANVNVGDTYSAQASVSNCDFFGSCTSAFMVTNAYHTGPPSINSASYSSATTPGSQGTLTLNGTNLSGPPPDPATPTEGDLANVNISGSGVTLTDNQPANYSQSTSDLSASTLQLSYTIAPDAPIASNSYTLTTVWGTSGTSTFSVVCPAPSIQALSQGPWTAGQDTEITITGTGFCADSTVAISVQQGSVQVQTTYVDSQRITARIKPDAGDPTESATVTVNSSGGSSSSTGQIAGLGDATIYFIDPYLLPGYNGGSLATDTFLYPISTATDPNSLDSLAQSIIADGVSTAIIAVKLQQSSGVQISLNAPWGTLSQYDPNFLHTAPTSGSTSISVTPQPYGSAYYAIALVTASAPSPAFSIGSGAGISVVVNGNATSNNTASMQLDYPAVILLHGLWGDNTSLIAPNSTINDFLTDSGRYPNSWVLPTCYSKYLPFYAATNSDTLPGSGFGCEFTSTDAIDNRLKDVYALYDDEHVVGGRVDVIAHSMGGLAIRNYGGRADYLTNVRSRNMGAINNIITLDTPSQGSLLADKLIQMADTTLQSGTTNPTANSYYTMAGCEAGDTVQTCFARTEKYISYPGYSAASGAVASLEAGAINQLQAPAKPPNSTWTAVVSAFPDDVGTDCSTVCSMLRTGLQNLMGNFVPLTSLPFSLSTVLQDSDNDVIVTTTSQSSGSTAAADHVFRPTASLSHTGVGIPSYVNLLLNALGWTDANVLNSSEVNNYIYQVLHPYP